MTTSVKECYGASSSFGKKRKDFYGVTVSGFGMDGFGAKKIGLR
jgi:hypothetical protein